MFPDTTTVNVIVPWRFPLKKVSAFVTSALTKATCEVWHLSLLSVSLFQKSGSSNMNKVKKKQRWQLLTSDFSKTGIWSFISITLTCTWQRVLKSESQSHITKIFTEKLCIKIRYLQENIGQWSDSHSYNFAIDMQFMWKRRPLFPMGRLKEVLNAVPVGFWQPTTFPFWSKICFWGRLLLFCEAASFF